MSEPPSEPWTLGFSFCLGTPLQTALLVKAILSLFSGILDVFHQ